MESNRIKKGDRVLIRKNAPSEYTILKEFAYTVAYIRKMTYVGFAELQTGTDKKTGTISVPTKYLEKVN